MEVLTNPSHLLGNLKHQNMMLVNVEDMLVSNFVGTLPSDLAELECRSKAEILLNGYKDSMTVTRCGSSKM